MRKIPWIKLVRKRGLAEELKSLPFEVTMFGKVKAVVLDPEDSRLKPQPKQPKQKMPARMYGPYSTV